MLSFARSASMIGLDISPSSVKLVELSRTKGRYRVERMGIEPLPRTGVGAAGAVDIDMVAAAIAALFKRTSARAKEAATALSGALAIIKIISLPVGLSLADIDEQIRIEGSQYIPYSMEGVNFDFIVLGPDETRAGYEKILLVACKREAVEDRVAILDRAGLTARVVDIEPFSLLAVYEHIAAQPGGLLGQTVALVDIGSSNTKINVFQNGQPIYNREHGFGGERLTEDIMRRYRLSYEDAGRMKRMGGLPEDYQQEVLTSFVDSMGLDLLRSLEFFQSNMPNVHIDQVVLFGGCAQISGVTGILRERVQMPIIVADPFLGMDTAANIDIKRLHQEGPSLAVACGLAMRRFDPR